MRYIIGNMCVCVTILSISATYVVYLVISIIIITSPARGVPDVYIHLTFNRRNIK